MEQQKRVRQELGVDPNRLLVLSLTAFDQAQIELLDRLRVAVVEELREKLDDRNLFRLVVQFPDEATLLTFRKEFAAYERSEPATTALPAGKRRTLFDALESVSAIQPEQRTGERLKVTGPPVREPFWMDLDLWYPGDPRGGREVEREVRALVEERGGQMLDPIRTSSLLLTKVFGDRKLLDALTKLDLVATVDLPPAPLVEEAFDYLDDQPAPDVQVEPPPEGGPLACVVDSGILSGHPLLRDLVVDYRDFNSGEDTEQDRDGHGSAVAGIVALGDLARQLVSGVWQARVWLLNAKVLRRDPEAADDDFHAVFPDELRAEHQLEQALRHFHNQGCRVFNLSVGHLYRAYRGGRQQPWAEIVDRLVRELDIVVVIAAGNCFPQKPAAEGTNRQELLQYLESAMLDEKEERRVLDPGSASIALTVGSCSRRSDPKLYREEILAAPVGRPSFFTRCGPGVNGSVKPELSAPGGNYGVKQMAGNWIWDERNPHLGEPVPDIRYGRRPIRAACATSFAAPHVTHACARAERVLEEYLGSPPSANLIRALVVNVSAYRTGLPANSSLPVLFDDPADLAERRLIRGMKEREEFLKRYLPWLGFGTPVIEDLLWSNQRRICLLAEDTIAERSFHVYQVRLPDEFVHTKGTRRIAVTMAYDPPVRASRQWYLATSLWMDVYRGLTSEQVFEARRHYTKAEQAEGEEVPKELKGYKLDLKPASGSLPLLRSTVQHRVWSSDRGTALDKTPEGLDEAVLHVFVGRRADRFPIPEEDEMQKYALVVTLSHSDDRLRLYDLVRSRVRTRARVPARVRVGPG